MPGRIGGIYGKISPMTRAMHEKGENAKPTLALVSLGCAKNAVDLQVRAGALLKRGYRLSPDPDSADVVIVNTCAFIASARAEAESEIARALALKSRGRYRRVVVAGCYPKRYPRAYAKFPGVTLRTTVMTGFPGETPLRFARMRADLKRMQFDRLGAFAYSPEAGTKGAKMSGRPSRKVAEERERIVMSDAEAVWKVKSARQIGSVEEALVVAPGVARLASQAPDVDGVVYLLDSERARAVRVGDFATVRLESVSGFDVEGDVL